MRGLGEMMGAHAPGSTERLLCPGTCKCKVNRQSQENPQPHGPHPPPILSAPKASIWIKWIKWIINMD